LKKSISFIFIVTFFTSTLFAKADKKLVEEYLKVSGANQIVLALPKQIELGYIKNIKDKKRKIVNIEKSFDSKKARKYIKKVLISDFRNGILKKIILFYKTPLGKKYKKLGITSIDERNIKKRAKFLKKIQKKPPTYTRINIMNAFVDRLELTPIAVHLIGESLGSIKAKLDKESDKKRVFLKISENIREAMLVNSLYAYDSFTNDELKQVMDYYYTNAGRFEQVIVSGVFKKLIMESFSQIVEDKKVKTANIK